MGSLWEMTSGSNVECLALLNPDAAVVCLRSSPPISSPIMLGDDDDVFDSVTWESPSAPVYEDHIAAPSGPGFRQSTADSGDPHEPKWEGYLVTSVKDPNKELAETKDAYVSYLVTARVCSSLIGSISR